MKNISVASSIVPRKFVQASQSMRCKSSKSSLNDCGADSIAKITSALQKSVSLQENSTPTKRFAPMTSKPEQTCILITSESNVS